MKIDKTIKGNVFRYHVNLIPNTMTAEVRFWSSDEPTIGTITEDFKFILLPNEFVSPWITDFGRVPVKKLKLNRHQGFDAKDYNENYQKS